MLGFGPSPRGGGGRAGRGSVMAYSPQIYKGYFGKVLVQVIQLYHLTQLDHVLQLDYMDDVVTVHLKVPRGIWMALRADAMGRGRSAQEHVVGMFRVAYGVDGSVRVAESVKQDITKSGRNPEVDAKITGSTPVTHSKPPLITDKPSDEPFQDIYSIETGKCGVCGESFPVNLLQEVRVPGTTKKKNLCAGCVENARNNQ